MNFRLLSHTMGYILWVEAGFLLLPALTACIYAETCWQQFLLTALLCAAAGTVLHLIPVKKTQMHSRDGFAAVALSWVLLALCGIGVFAAAIVLAIVLADMAAGIFKHSGPLKGLWADFPPRWRPMFTPSLEGLEITPDSLRALRRAAMPHDWAVHVPPEAVSGMYGTVSAHAATIVALAVLSCGAIRRKWFTALMVVCTLVICYSRIYLGKHFPMDIVWGTLVGLGLGYAALRGYLRLAQSRNRRFTHPG